MKNTSTHMVFLHGRLVDLRPIERADLPIIQRGINNPDIWQFLNSGLPKSLADEEKWLEGLVSKPNDIILAIVTKQGQLIGMTGLHHISWQHGHATAGAFIGDHAFHGRGYGTDSLMTMLEYAFNTLGLRKVKSEVIGFNKRSLAHALKCGFRQIGRMRQHFFRRGRHWDMIMIEVFRPQWQHAYQQHLKKFPRRSRTSTPK